jgi:hypothetical protein
MDPVRLESAGRYNDHDLARMARLIVEHQALLVRRWDEECERAKEAGQ